MAKTTSFRLRTRRNQHPSEAHVRKNCGGAVLACLFRFRNPHRALRKFADVDNSDWHDYFSFCEFPRRICLEAYQRGTVCCPRLVGVTAACAMCSALDACITLYRYTIRDNGTNGRIILVSPWHLALYTVRRTGSRRIRRISVLHTVHKLVSRILDRLSSRKYTV